MAGKGSTPPGGAVWRGMRDGDLPAVLAMAAAVHPGHPESPAVFAERLALYPAGCLVLAGGGGALGYAIAHPWSRGQAVPLDVLLRALPAAPDVMYLHDLALLPAARGLGAGRAALRRLASLAGGMPLALVALPGTEEFWRGQGFAPVPGGAPPGYGPGALPMERCPPGASSGGSGTAP